MIDCIKIDTTQIYVAPIALYQGSNRREREINAVRHIIDNTLGPIALTHDENGAPHIAGYNVSISHSALLAVVAIDATRRIGIDAEEWRPTLQRVKERFLSANELLIFNTDRQLLSAWTIKEAVYKLVGTRATEFSTAISISPDMATATCCGSVINIAACDIGDTHISLSYF